MSEEEVRKIDLERTQIVGLNLKTFWAVIVGVFSCMVTSIWAAVWVVSTFKNVVASQDKYNEINNLQVRNMQVQLQLLEVEVKQLSQKVDVNTVRIEERGRNDQNRNSQ